MAVTLEQDLDEPEKSALFKRHPTFYKDKEAMHFLLRYHADPVTGGVDTHDLDHIMETDLEILQPAGPSLGECVNDVADSLPGLGIVAAVLEWSSPMGSLSGPPEEIGQKVAAALVGTFLAFCCVMVSWVRWQLTQKTHGRGRRVPLLACAWAYWRISRDSLRCSPWKRRGAPFRITCGRRFRKWTRPAAKRPIAVA